MILANLHDATDLREYYNLLSTELNKAHGPLYSSYLIRIKDLFKDCKSYREIGTWQGASTSTALLENIPYIETIDISFQHINPYLHLFKNYAETNSVDFVMIENDSLKHLSEKVTEVLLIDGYHNAKHVAQELDLYSKITAKFIMLHDTTLFPRLQKVVSRFLERNTDWAIHEKNEDSVGFTVLKKC